VIWESLLSASIEAGRRLVAEVGFDAQVSKLKEEWPKADERRRRHSLDETITKAVKEAGEESIKPLLNHRPFQ